MKYFVHITTHKTAFLRFFILASILTLSSTARAQTDSPQAKSRKGRMYISWGYNRSAYTPSDIHFKGPNYDFTLYGVTATDRPTEFSINTYLNPAKATVPQYEVRFSYFISDKVSVSAGVSHLKYVVTQDQGTNITGYIDNAASRTHSGTYDFNTKALESNFLRFEHTNGLNYGSIEIETMMPLMENQLFTRGLYLTTAVGAGVITPKSAITLFNAQKNNVFHLAGYAINSKLGLKFEFMNKFFIKGFANLGYVNLPNIRTRSGDGGDRASQSFYFIEGSVVAGVLLHTFK